MSFPRYPSYKDSGVEWLGKVPAHWTPIPIKLVAKLDSGHTPSRSHPEYWQDCTVPWFTLGDVWQIREGARYIFETKEKVSELGLANSSARLLPKATVMLSRTASVGFAAIMGIPMATTQDFANWICGPRVQPEFLLYAFESMKGEFRRLMMGSTHNTIYMPDIQSLRFVLPPRDEQDGLVAFLDRETGKIYELVAEQRRLMELLKEKRQAVISHTVTRGLNPAAPLKPSGIEWLGDVPKHWEIRKMSHFFRAGKGKNGQMLTKEFCGANPGDYPVYSGQTENDGIMGTWDQFEFAFGEKGVLFSTTVGAKAMHLRQLFGQFSLSQNCMIIWSTSERCETRFYYYHFQPLFQFERALIPEHMQASFRIEDLYGYKVAVPPVDEQLAITTHLDGETAKFDTLTAEAQRAIDLLQERRTALISAAVTGQIDVR